MTKNIPYDYWANFRLYACFTINQVTERVEPVWKEIYDIGIMTPSVDTYEIKQRMLAKSCSLQFREYFVAKEHFYSSKLLQGFYH